MNRFFKKTFLVTGLALLTHQSTLFAAGGELDVEIYGEQIYGDGSGFEFYVRIKEGSGYVGNWLTYAVTYDIDYQTASGTPVPNTPILQNLAPTKQSNLTIGDITNSFYTPPPGYDKSYKISALAVSEWGNTYVDAFKVTVTFSGGTITQGALARFNPTLDDNITNWLGDDFNTYPVASSQSIVPLPINLVDFSATKTNDARVQLNWITASEENTKDFFIERSANGKAFTEVVAGMKAAGTSSTELNYQTYDRLPLKGNNFYRLKTVDNDGKVHYSKTVMVKFDVYGEGGIVKVYPTNNTTGVIFVDLPSGYDNAQTGVINLNGQKMQVDEQQYGDRRVITLNNAPAGQYTVTIWNNGQLESFKLIYNP